MTARTLSTQHGLTLVEVLVALSLLAILGLLGYRGLDQVRSASARVDTLATRWQELALATERMGRDAAQALAQGGRAADGRTAPPWQGTLDAQGPALLLTRLHPETGDLQGVAYRWRAGSVELGLWPADEPSAPGRSHVLLQGISAMELAYLDRQGQWQLRWPTMAGAPALPRALRVRLALQEGGQVERIFDVPAAD